MEYAGRTSAQPAAVWRLVGKAPDRGSVANSERVVQSESSAPVQTIAGAALRGHHFSEVVVQRQATTTGTTANATTWQDTAEQKAFLEKVLAAHIARSSRRGRQPLPDLGGAELATVSGTDVQMQKDAASAAGMLIGAANSALAAAKQGGDQDANKTIRISATSGYRGRSHQETLWRTYFRRRDGYYEATAATRAALPGGAHGDAAAQWMASTYIPWRIAAPGFSNHQAGIAIDLWQERTKGAEIRNATDSAAKAKWHRTWFFRWLQANASTHKFEEYSKEPWHWTYQGTKTAGSSASPASGGGATTGSARPGPPEAVSTEASGTTSEAWLARAVARNAQLGGTLGWNRHIDAIVAFFQELGYLPPLQSPDEPSFVRAVRQYQARSAQLTGDGILGANTWRQLQADIL